MGTPGSAVHVLGRGSMDSRGAVCLRTVGDVGLLPVVTAQLWGQGGITGWACPPLPLVLAAVPGSPEL